MSRLFIVIPIFALIILSGCGRGPGDDGSSSSSTSSSGSPAPSAPAAVLINEVAATNDSFTDEDGDTPDWFELFNPSPAAISLNGWSITDTEDEPEKWLFPDMTLGADEILKVWASGKDRTERLKYRTLIELGTEFSYIIPNEDTPLNWFTPDFDASGWLSGLAGFGFGDGDDQTVVAEGTSAVYMRTEFIITNATQINHMILHMDFDDGFIAYINGVKVAEDNMGADVGFNALAIEEREALRYQGQQASTYTIDTTDILNKGINTLAIQVHNISSESSDLSASPILSAAFMGTSTDGKLTDPSLGLVETELHTNFKISSAGETLYLFDEQRNLIHQFEVLEAPSDISQGISISNFAPVFYAEPSPGSKNSSDETFGFITSEVQFSHDGGVLSPSIITLDGAGENEVIRYTLDASLPDEQSLIYSTAINVEKNTVIRAGVFRPQYLPTHIASRTFLVDQHHDIDVVTLVVDPLDFFDVETGMYVNGPNYQRQNPHYGANFWENWERDIHFTFYEADGL